MTENIVERTIMWGDLDALGIVFYPRYYEWFDGCGHLFFDTLGLNLVVQWEKRQMQFALVESGCQYMKPGRYNQKIKIHTRIQDLSPKTVTLSHHIYTLKDEILMVSGVEKRICLDVSDAKQFKAMNIPDDIYSRLDRARIPEPE